MLDSTTKKRIDDARDTLVGKLPDPKSQVEQITIALIYKFMDDMDRASVKLGGKAKFFSGAFKDYAWDKVFDTKLAGHEIVKAYGDAIQQLDKNPNVPQLFRNIFKNAYLPYRDPETLKSFLTIIDEFEYDHSEKLGDAFEYLLSVLGSQGELGQFRTPRHIIDFIVEVVNPQKNEKILDPACGTAGFLISAYKHILKRNSKNYSPENDSKGFAIRGVNLNEVVIENKDFPGDKLTSDDRARLVKNIFGYDISPDMIRLSLVNLYLHGFPDPKIAEYDTLTSEDRWNEYADVILANPPFMTPKGGIKPHKRFSIQSNRSEVLFVDYMLEHLSPTGRAGIIVPEGIVFNSQNAFTQMRRMLVEKFLVAVVSLPAGVFNPYSGVKTSILIIDKTLAKKAKSIAFFKVENDGFDLGAQRRAIEKNDLPQVFAEASEYLRCLRDGGALIEYMPRLGNVVEKEKILTSDDYNLSAERYRTGVVREASFPYVRLDEIAEIAAGNSAPQGAEYFNDGQFPFVRTSDVGSVHLSDNLSLTADKVNQRAITEFRLRLFPAGTILFPKSGASTFLNHRAVLGNTAYVSSHLACIICNETKVLPKYAYSILCHVDARKITPDQAYPSLRLTEIGSIQIPLPPLDEQKQIVTEIEGFQKIIDGARAITDNYRPHILIDPKWPIVELGGVCKIKGGYAFKSSDFVNNGVQLIRMSNVKRMLFDSQNSQVFLPHSFLTDYTRYRLKKCDILISMTGTVGKEDYGNVCMIDVEGDYLLNQRVGKFEVDTTKLNPHYIYHIAQSDGFRNSLFSNTSGGVRQANISNTGIERVKIPLPPLATQEIIVSEIEAEQSIINANRQLISRFEKKIQATLARVWGEDEKPSAKSQDKPKVKAK